MKAFSTTYINSLGEKLLLSETVYTAEMYNEEEDECYSEFVQIILPIHPQQNLYSTVKILSISGVESQTKLYKLTPATVYYVLECCNSYAIITMQNYNKALLLNKVSNYNLVNILGDVSVLILQQLLENRGCIFGNKEVFDSIKDHLGNSK